MTPDRCATIAAHAARVLAPATMHAADVLIVRLRADGHPITATPAQLARRVQACGVALDHVQRGLPDAVLSLAAQRECAAGGRLRTGQSGGSSATSGPSRPTEDIATELLRIRLVGLTLVEAIDRLHPDPLWPPLASGGRGRTQTATECLTAACGASHGTLSPVQAWDDLLDAIAALWSAQRIAEPGACAQGARLGRTTGTRRPATARQPRAVQRVATRAGRQRRTGRVQQLPRPPRPRPPGHRAGTLRRPVRRVLPAGVPRVLAPATANGGRGYVLGVRIQRTTTEEGGMTSPTRLFGMDAQP